MLLPQTTKAPKVRTKGAGECWRLAGQPDQAIPSYTGVGSKSLNTSVAPNPTLQPPTFRRTDSSLASLHAWTCSYNQEFAGPILLGTCAHPRMFSSTFTFKCLACKIWVYWFVFKVRRYWGKTHFPLKNIQGVPKRGTFRIFKLGTTPCLAPRGRAVSIEASVVGGSWWFLRFCSRSSLKIH